jgi:hypothetical protein
VDDSRLRERDVDKVEGRRLQFPRHTVDDAEPACDAFQCREARRSRSPETEDSVELE